MPDIWLYCENRFVRLRIAGLVKDIIISGFTFVYSIDHFIVLHNEQKYVDVFQDQTVHMVSVENLLLANPDRYPAIWFNTRYPTGYRK